MSLSIGKLKKIKTLQKGGKSKYVYLMEHQIVKKAYRRDHSGQKRRFEQEVRILQHLKDCPFVPKLIKVNRQKCILWMTWVGKTLEETPSNRNALNQKIKELHLEWNLLRHRNGAPNYQIYIKNGTKMNNQIYVIDFGSPHYQIIGPSVVRSDQKEK